MIPQEKLDLGIGTEDSPKLMPKDVKIVEVEVGQKTWGTKVTDVLVVKVKHPDRNDPFQIYNLSFLKGTNVKTVGFSISYDSEGKVQKESGIAELMRRTQSASLKELIGKTVPTLIGKEGYLTLKAF